MIRGFLPLVGDSQFRIKIHLFIDPDKVVIHWVEVEFTGRECPVGVKRLGIERGNSDPKLSSRLGLALLPRPMNRLARNTIAIEICWR